MTAPAESPTPAFSGIQGCFSTMGCPELTLDQVADLAGKFALPLLELRSLEGTTNLPALLAAKPGGWVAAKENLLQRGLAVRVLGTGFKLVGHEEAHWQELFDFAALADALETPYLRIFGGGKWGVPLTASDEAGAVRTVREWEAGREARGLRAQILVETHDAFSATPPCLRLVEQLDGDEVSFIWDSHHTWRLARETPADSWKALGPHVRHVHIKDSVDVPSARHPYTYVLPGTGQMPAGEVVEILKNAGWSGGLSLEWEKMWHPYLVELSEALAAARVLRWF